MFSVINYNATIVKAHNKLTHLSYHYITLSNSFSSNETNKPTTKIFVRVHTAICLESVACTKACTQYKVVKNVW